MADEICKPLQIMVLNFYLKALNCSLTDCMSHYVKKHHVQVVNSFSQYRSTTHVDEAYCYQPSSVVCWSVTIVSPAKTAKDVWVEHSGAPKEPWIRWGPDPPMGRSNFDGAKGRPIAKCRDTLQSSVQND